MVEQTATARLREEHRSIQEVVAAMVVLADRLESGKAVKAETLREVVEFMHLVYEIHEKKEEACLFPALQRRGVSVHSVPSRRLVEEHRRSKALVAALGKDAGEYEKLGAEAVPALLGSLRGLAALYPLHIWEEELLLFPQAESTLSKEDNQELIKGFDAVGVASAAEGSQGLDQRAEKIEKAVW